MEHFSNLRPVGWLVAAVTYFLLACSGPGIPESQVFSLIVMFHHIPTFVLMSQHSMLTTVMPK